MYTAFSTALSALNATSTAIDVVGNNLANLNTTGFKGSSVSFYDMVTQSEGGGFRPTQVGLGTAPPVTVSQFTQGSVQSSSGQFDAAIKGDGFFIVKNSSNQSLYTRAGDFTMDANGNLLTGTGESVQGWSAATDGTINTTGVPGNIQVPAAALLKPVATTEFSLAMNLNSSAVAGSSDSPFSTPIQAVDSLGNKVDLTVTFTKDPINPNQWTYQVTIPGTATTGGTAGTPTNLLSSPGVLSFDSTGHLAAPTPATPPAALAITGLSDGAADMSINFNLFDSGGTPTITQFAQSSAVSSNSQDGQTAGQLTKIGMGDGGQVMAQYSNGKQVVLAQLALASIRNPSSMVSVGNNNFELGAQTATPAVGTADTGGRGEIVGGSLEASTVDVATQFTNLIVFQRAYEANSKIVTTMDTLTQDTINLVR